jgi:putative ABC transport system permease protein
LQREVDAHLGFLEDDYERRGMTREDARIAARRHLSSLDTLKEQQRDARSFVALEETRRNLRQAIRALARTPGFVAITTLTIGLAIGSIVTVFSVVNAVVLKPLPYDNPAALVRLVETVSPADSANGGPQRRVTNSLSVGELDELRHRTRTVSEIAAYLNASLTLTDSQSTFRLEGWRVEPSLFPALGVRPLFGRTFEPGDGTPGTPNVIVLGYRAWQQYLGGRPDVVGQVLTLDNTSYTVIAVMPKAFIFPVEFPTHDFWLPLTLNVTTKDARGVRLPTVIRLASGVSLEMAAGEVTAVLRSLNGKAGQYHFVRVQDEWIRPITSALQAFSIGVLLVFLVAGVNVLALMVARTAAREREIAIRAALGGRRALIVGLLITESVLLALLGSAMGILLAFAGSRLLRTLAAPLARMDLGMFTAFPRLDEVTIDLSVLSFAVMAALIMGIACGLGPALRYTRQARGETLRQGGGSTGSPVASWRWRSSGFLLVMQISLAMILLISSGLLVTSYVKLSSVRLGYNPSRVLTFQVALPAGRYRGPALELFAESLVARLGALPHVTAAAYTPLLPMVTLLEHSASFRRTPAMPPSGGPADDLRGVSTDYFRVMGIDLIGGRSFEPADKAGSPRVVVINRAMVRQHFSGEDPIGKFAYLARSADPWQVVGVVEDVRQLGPREVAKPQAFVDSRQWPGMAPGFRFLQYYAVRLDSPDWTALLPLVRDAVRTIDQDGAVYNVAPMEALLANATSRPRLYAALAGSFSAVVAFIVAIGLYGVVSRLVAHRTREIGIRVALGAPGGVVMRLVLARSAAAAAAGIGLGCLGASVMTRYMQGMLFGVSSLDASTFVTVALMFGSIALLASWLPARRALSVDPLIALRHD